LHLPESIQQLDRKRQAQLSQISQQLPGSQETFIDLEGAVEIWIVDQAFPSNSRSGLFEVLLRMGQHVDGQYKLAGN
jgi:hypothetical protein